VDLARYWHRHGDLDEAARHATRLATTDRAEAAVILAAIDRDRDDAAACLANLVHAVDLLRAAPTSLLLVRALTDLGDAHRRAGRYPQAVTTLREALAATTDPRQLAAGLTVLAITAKELGAYREAGRWYARVGALHETYAAPLNDRATLEHNRAGLAYAQRRFSKAEDHARRAVLLRRRAPLDLAGDLAVLGAAVAGQNRHDEAREHLRRALKIFTEARPPRRYEIAVQLHNLAAVDHAAGSLAAAEEGYLRALAIKEELLGSDHPEVGVICNNLGTLRPDQDWLDRALAITGRALGAGHPTTRAVRLNLRAASGRTR
jgi:tetratricopeptide (TPR) repeat protein